MNGLIGFGFEGIIVEYIKEKLVPYDSELWLTDVIALRDKGRIFDPCPTQSAGMFDV